MAVQTRTTWCKGSGLPGEKVGQSSYARCPRCSRRFEPHGITVPLKAVPRHFPEGDLR